MSQRQQYLKEFKREAVRLLESDERSATTLARDLRVRGQMGSGLALPHSADRGKFR